MSPSRDRSILRAISITSLISASYLLSELSSKGHLALPHHLALIPTTISGLNIAVLFSWLAFEAFGGIPVTTLAVVIALWAILRTGSFSYYIFVLPLLLIGFIGYGCSASKRRTDQLYILRLEKLDEELNLLSDSIEKKKGYIKSLEEKLSGYSNLKEVTESLSTVLALDDINRLIVDYTLKMLKKEARMLIFLVDVEKQELMLSYSKGTEDSLKVKTKKGDLFDQWVLRHRKPLIIEDVTQDFRFPADSVEEAKKIFRSLISSPFVSEKRVIGILRMDNLKASAYSQDDLRLLDIMSDLGAVAIQNAILYSRTQELAIRDGLTGLYLRRYFIERLREEMKRAARRKGALSLLMLDIDHFKDYNDRYGHMAGDLVLKHMARKINSMARESDIVARYGGEEIVILLFGTDKRSALEQAEAIRRKIEEEPLILRKKRMGVTVSIGVSTYPQDAALEEELIGKADERLYRAKAQGRNKVC